MIGTTFAKRYEIRGFLGKGGMGEVWLAFDKNHGREVALKLFPAGSLTIHAYHEARVLTLLANDNVLRVYNADTYVDVPYLATAVARAGTTEHRGAAAPGLGLPAPVTIRWIRHGLIGLDACHAVNLVHRDIKSSNLFLNGDDWALLGDFGIAYPIDASGRVPAGGTPVTKPPEMISAGYGTKVSDIYAIGVTAYRLLVGRWPFEGATEADVEAAVVDRAYVPLRDAAPHVSRRLADRIETAMAADEAARYSSAMALHDELGKRGLVGRIWQRQSPHPGHLACWRETQGSRSPLKVCVVDQGGRGDIQTQFAGSGRRIRTHCISGVRPRDLSVRLRRVFDHL